MPGMSAKQSSLKANALAKVLTNEPDISHHINRLTKKIVRSGEIFIEVTGFYFKKLFCPWPLNFTIVKINKKLYLMAGFLILIFFIFILMTWLLKKRLSLCLFSIVWIFSFFMPAIAVIYFNIAWTPLA